MESKRSKYVLIALTVFCVLLIGLTSIHDEWLTPLRTGVGYFLIPVQSGVNAVGSAIYDEIIDYTKLHDALNENKEMKEIITQLTEENTRLQAEEFELKRLRQLYSLDQDYGQYTKVGARVIANDSSNWFQIFRIDKGSKDGIAPDMNVVAGGGLVGIVTDVGANYATVRSIIDDSSRVSGMAMQSGNSCIVAGDLTLFKEGRLRITNVLKESDVKDGDKIVTSNISSVFLPGILVGYASGITNDTNNVTKSGYLIPAAKFDSLQEVLVITKLKADMMKEEASQEETAPQETNSSETETAESASQ
ncbi:MAG: rod shape-determining protein MreC [Lacrimispora sphenoides]|uniref:Cell shape-determining protein MreC n=1 Tax=Lacrimispora sphenoides JCM 1415 TaxID=1297793 RepID=A0ABY1C6P7_9FIRM|nr:rod shape-determining protein MreC [Lacrimispora sphenoides]SET74737.1 rod shape-determining protein MreC [[Clostridium] sphenoides JCM 1415]SUY50955.1 rod shape-determining protein MreC [Lacrimispora sphenoides]